MRTRNLRVMLAIGLVAALAVPAVADAKGKKKKENYVEDIVVNVYTAEEVEDPYMVVSIKPHRDTGKRVKVKYSEHIGDGKFNVIGIERAKVGDDGYAHITFDEVSQLEFCDLEIKQPGNKKVKAAIYSTGFECQTGEIAAG